MRYHVVHIETCFDEEWQYDVFVQQLFDLGFDTIDEQDAYIPSDLWEAHRSAIESLCAATEGVVSIHAEACPDANWNAEWESSHAPEELPLGVRIVPHCAFGAGHHETTSMMLDALQDKPLNGLTVLDHGTGTGVLAVFAKRLGAAHVTAVDIDEKSVANAKENAALNVVTIDVLHTSDFHFPDKAFDLILANIHRNILLDHMAFYARSLRPGGELWMSGFYESDCAPLIDACKAHGLEPISTHAKNEWRMVEMRAKS